MADGRVNNGGPRPNSGRPPGRTQPHVLRMALDCREMAEEMVQVLYEIAMRGTSEQSRIIAANSILDRGFGKPFQAVGIVDNDKGPTRIIIEGGLPNRPRATSEVIEVKGSSVL